MIASTYRRYVSLLGIAFMCPACHKAAPLPSLPESRIAQPNPADVESVVFLIGDMGEATMEHNPLVQRLRLEVERWSNTLRRDSSVAVVFLGDNVYPAGLHDANDKNFLADSARLEAQVNILAGPRAKQFNSFGVFIAGNHDWGHMPGAPGVARLKNQQNFLERRRPGVNVALMPNAGVPGPGIIDVGLHIRILLIDTAWWLLTADKEEKLRTMGRLQSQMASAGNRDVIIASHHPFKSASAHGGLVSFWKGIGLEWLLNRTGAALQDLNSLPYRDFRDRLNATFRATRPPLVYAGGHDHALQLMRATQPTDPRFIAVSGSGSKTSPIGNQDGMMFRSSDAGYMELIVRKNGGVDLFIYALPYSDSHCADEACMQKGIAAVSPRYSVTLK